MAEKQAPAVYINCIILLLLLLIILIIAYLFSLCYLIVVWTRIHQHCIPLALHFIIVAYLFFRY
jgi:hypothetical protein